MLRQFLIRCLANGVGLWIAATLIPGIEYNDNLWVIVIAAIIFSVINTFVRPVAVLFSLSAIILTLGLFTLIINTLMLYLVTVIYPSFEINSFGSAVLAVIIVWLVNYALNAILQPEREPEPERGHKHA